MNASQWSAHDLPSNETESAEFWERQWDAQQRSMRGPAAMFLVVLLVLLVLIGTGMAPILPILMSVLGIWLMIGRGNVLVRCLVTVAVVWILGRVFTRGSVMMPALVVCTTLSAAAICIAGLFVSHLSKAPTRRAQFSLRDVGCYMLAFGMGAALVREDMSSIMSQPRVPWEGIFALTLLCVNIALASLPVLVPKRYREGSLFLLSACLVLFVLPLLEGAFLHAFMFVPNLFRLVGLPVAHAVGAVLVWTLVFTLETAGGFVDDMSPRQVASGPEEPSEGIE